MYVQYTLLLLNAVYQRGEGGGGRGEQDEYSPLWEKFLNDNVSHFPLNLSLSTCSLLSLHHCTCYIHVLYIILVYTCTYYNVQCIPWVLGHLGEREKWTKGERSVSKKCLSNETVYGLPMTGVFGLYMCIFYTYKMITLLFVQPLSTAMELSILYIGPIRISILYIGCTYMYMYLHTLHWVYISPYFTLGVHTCISILYIGRIYFVSPYFTLGIHTCVSPTLGVHISVLYIGHTYLHTLHRPYTSEWERNHQMQSWLIRLLTLFTACLNQTLSHYAYACMVNHMRRTCTLCTSIHD